MASDVMSVRLWLPRIKVLEVVADAPERLVVRVASTVRCPGCPGCGTPSGRCHDRREREIRDLEVSGRPVILVWSQRRMVCDGCGRRFMEAHRAFEGSVTARLARRLVNDARSMPVNTVPHRSQAALSAFLASQGHKWCRGVKVVVSDGSKAYKAAIDARLGHARHVLARAARPLPCRRPQRRDGRARPVRRHLQHRADPEFSDTVDTFLAWHNQILGWHHAGRPPNGRIDRTNNLLQVLRRTAHGFTNYANFEARGILLT